MLTNFGRIHLSGQLTYGAFLFNKVIKYVRTLGSRDVNRQNLNLVLDGRLILNV